MESGGVVNRAELGDLVLNCDKILNRIKKILSNFLQINLIEA
jgi:hypothetical protein